MARETLKTLFHPFEAGALSVPEGGRALFLGAEPGFRLPEGFGATIAAMQGFRPSFLALRAAGVDVVPEVDGEGYELALVLLGRHRGQNEGRVAEALARVVPGGLVLVAGAQEDGIASLRKRIGALFDIEGAMPKYHGVAFWFRVPERAADAIAALRPEAVRVDGRFAAAPGMFSHDRVDAGSRLLADCLPDSAKGRAADFGAGWGYLSAMLAERTAGIEAIDLYEADYGSLQAARENLAAAPGPRFGFHWHDLAGEPVTERYDLIVMNPPFHQGRAAEPDLGRAMIRAASAALVRGGRLLLVANRGLPYDETLAAGFGAVEDLRREGGFRVISARR